MPTKKLIGQDLCFGLMVNDLLILFMGIFDFFIERSAKKKIANDPIYIAAIKESERALQETNLYKIRDKLTKPAEELAEEINSILMSEDRFMANRKKYAETVLAFSKYQVLVLDKEDPSSDSMGLIGLPGITGEIRKHLVKIGERDELIAEDLHGQSNTPNKLNFEFMKHHIRAKYLILYWRLAVFNTIRIGLEDHNSNLSKDWRMHLLYSMCVCHEYKFREMLKLKQNITIEQEILNSTILNITLNGERYPDLAFYQQNKEKIDSKKLFFKKIW